MTRETDTRPTQWPGYTLEEMRMARAVNDVRIDLVKHQLSAITAPYEKPARTARTLSGKLLGALSFVDYAVLAFKVIGHVRRWMGRKSGR